MNPYIPKTAAEVILNWLDNGVESDPFPYSAIYEVIRQNGERDQGMRKAYEQGGRDERKRVLAILDAWVMAPTQVKDLRKAIEAGDV